MGLLKYLVGVLLIAWNIQVTAAPDTSAKYKVILDISDQWLGYDKSYKTYFPLINKREDLKSASLLIDLDRYKNYSLSFKTQPGLTLFIEGELVYRSLKDHNDWISIPISNLKTIPDEKELITFYNPDGHLPLRNFYIASDQIENASGTIINNKSKILVRPERQQSLYVMIFLIILIVIVVLKARYPRKFFEFFGFSKVIPEKDDTLVWDPFGTPFLLFVLINALCSTLVVLVIKREFDLDPFDFLNILNSNSVIGVLITVFVFCLIYFIKYIQLKFFGWVFNVRLLVKQQFLELMKVALKVNLFLTILILIFYGSSYGLVDVHFSYFFYFTLLTMVIVLLRVGYLTFTLSGFRNIYLFSYLCTTEILPLVIITKLILF